MRKTTTFLMPFLLFAMLFCATSCGGDKPRDVQLAEIGREINFSINQGVKTARSLHRSGFLNDDIYVHILQHSKRIQTSADVANKQLDRIAYVDANNKAQVMAVLARLINDVDNTLYDPAFQSIEKSTRDNISQYLRGISVSVRVASALVQVIEKPTSTKAIKFQYSGVK